MKDFRGAQLIPLNCLCPINIRPLPGTGKFGTRDSG
jgi:hypothetical protein